MHKHAKTGEDVTAPEPVQRTKNLVEEFFGLKLADTGFSSHEMIYGEGVLHARHDAADYYYCELLSPTGRTVHIVYFARRRDNGWVSIKFEAVSQWQEALQVAIDNFVNNPKGGPGVLGDFRPTVEKLNAAR